MPPRATPMCPEDRRGAIIGAALPLLREHGRSATTKQIAEAAGIAEGTIFRVFPSKDDLIAAAVAEVFEPSRLIEEIDAIGVDGTLRERALALVELTQERMSGGFALLRKLDLVKPPDIPGDPGRARALQQLVQATVELFRGDQAELAVPAAQMVQMLRLLTFTATHPGIAGSAGMEVLTPEQIVDAVLYGAVKRKDS